MTSKVFYIARANGSIPQCGRLTYVSATAIAFKPYAGDLIKINGILYQIPSGGISGVANTGVYVNGVSGQNLAASTGYYVYCFNNGGTLTADFCATGHATDTTSGNVGVEIKSGDSTRTLIGMIYTNGSSQFYSYKLSWFNRQPIILTASSGNMTNTNTTEAVTATLGVLGSWVDEDITAFSDGQGQSAGAYTRFDIGVDSSPAGVGTFLYQTASVWSDLTIGGTLQPSEGFHTYQLMCGATGGNGTGGSSTWLWYNVVTTIKTRG